MSLPSNKALAVIILNWNGLDLMKRFIPIAVCHTQGDEVDLVVADNGSTDDSVAWLHNNYPQIKVIELGKNYGYAEGYNRVINVIEHPYCILLNSDVEVTPGWWKPLLSFLQTHPEAGAVQPKVKSLTDKSRFEYAGAAGGFLDTLGYPYCRGRLFDRIETDKGQYDTPPIKVCWASGAAFAIPTALYKETGGLDPLFFAHMEEIDLCCRLWNSGHPVYAISDSEVYHLGGASLPQGNPQKTYLNFRNNLLLLYKNLPGKKRKRILFLRRLADTMALFMFAAKLDFPNARAVLKAHKDFRSMKSHYKELNALENNTLFPGMERKILIDRFLLNKYK